MSEEGMYEEHGEGIELLFSLQDDSSIEEDNSTAVTLGTRHIGHTLMKDGYEYTRNNIAGTTEYYKCKHWRGNKGCPARLIHKVLPNGDASDVMKGLHNHCKVIESEIFIGVIDVRDEMSDICEVILYFNHFIETFNLYSLDSCRRQPCDVPKGCCQ